MCGEADLLADLAHHVAEGLGALLPAECFAAIPDRAGGHQRDDAVCIVDRVRVSQVAVLEAADRLDIFEPLDALFQSCTHSASTQPSLWAQKVFTSKIVWAKSHWPSRFTSRSS